MQMIQMRALVAFDRNGKHVKPGDLFTAFPIEAASLSYNKKAQFASSARPAPAPTYGTRSMTAAVPGSAPAGGAERAATETTQAAAEPAQTAEAESAQTTDGSRARRPGRTYANRSIRASEG